MSLSCPAIGWNPTLSAPLASQLAAVLAGFVFTSIVFLIGSEGRRYAHALGLFCAAFVALGFDSHLYSVLSGAVGNCSRVWAQTVVASGMLGVGAMAMITGVIWLLSKHSSNEGRAEKNVRSDKSKLYSENPSLNGVLRTMAYGVSVAITTLLGSTVYAYLYIAKFPNHLPSSWETWIILPPVTIVTLTASLKLLRRFHPNFWPMKHPVSQVALRLATYGVLIYALAAAVFVGIITDFPDRWWNKAPEIVVMAVIISGVATPVLLFIILIQAKPPLSGSAKESKEPGRPRSAAEALNNDTWPNGHEAAQHEIIQQPSSYRYVPRHASTYELTEAVTPNGASGLTLAESRYGPSHEEGFRQVTNSFASPRSPHALPKGMLPCTA
jgi:hypothetical protein